MIVENQKEKDNEWKQTKIAIWWRYYDRISNYTLLLTDKNQ